MIPIIFFLLFGFFIFYLVSGIYILLKNKNSLTIRILFSICMNLSIWAMGVAFVTISPNIASANFWRMVSALGWCLIYSTWLDFAVLVKGENTKWMTDLRRLLIYLPSFYFFIGNLLYKPSDVLEKHGQIWLVKYPMSFFENLYIIYYITFSLAGIIIIYRWGKRATTQRVKKQARVIIITTLISFAAAAFTDTILPMLGIDIFPLGIVMLSFAVLGIRHAITKYKMMALSTQIAKDYILSTINNPVILIGNDFQVLEVNSAALALTGFSEEEFRSIKMDVLIADSMFNQFVVDYLMELGSVKNIEINLITKGEKRIPCLLSGASITNESGDKLGIACIFHDITDRKNAELMLIDTHRELEKKVYERTQELEEMNTLLEEEMIERLYAENELKANEEKFRSLMKQSSDGIIVLDPVSRKVVESNEVALRILGFTEEQMTNLITEKWLPISIEWINSAIDKIAEGESAYLKEVIKYKNNSNAYMDLEFSFSLVGYSEKQYIVIALRDITEMLIMEDRKQQMVKMESLGTLSGGIAHDFNNILAGIMGYTQLTLENIEGDPTSHAYLSEVMKLSERAKKLISQILTYSRKARVTPEIVDLRVIAEDVVKMLKATASSEIDIQCILGVNSYFIFADQTEMHQLLMNLCVNAEIAMKKMGGVLKIILSHVSFENEMIVSNQVMKSGEYIKLEVVDNGCGMDEVTQKRIFEPFFTTRSAQEGTGLGLSVVHGIVSRWDSFIMVSSELNKGSTFTIYFPSAKVNIVQPSQIEDTIQPSRARILLVDDEESIVKSVPMLLQGQGYYVTGVLSAHEALNLFKQNIDYFDLVITDQSMPLMTGDALVRELRILRPELPVLICSGYMVGQKNDRDPINDLTDFLIKPISKIRYIEAIEKLLNNR